MPKNNRIVKNYYLRGKDGRGSLWTLWLSPVIDGPNNIYFSGSGYLRNNRDEYGFVFHLSIHQDGSAHIKHQNDKMYKFQLTHKSNFPICSVYAHANDLLVPDSSIDAIIGDKIPINLSKIPNPHSFEWGHLLIFHLEESEIQLFLKNFGVQDTDFSIIDKIDIGQNRRLLVLFEFIQKIIVKNEMPDLEGLETYSNSNRLTIWGYRGNDEKHVIVHDFAANKPERIRSAYEAEPV